MLGHVRLIKSATEQPDWNSLRYTPTGGRVWVRVTPGTSQVLVEVVDTGIGIPVDEFTNMFDRFQTGNCAAASGTISQPGSASRSSSESWNSTAPR